MLAYMLAVLPVLICTPRPFHSWIAIANCSGKGTSSICAPAAQRQCFSQ
jgi:hypothetical protein